MTSNTFKHNIFIQFGELCSSFWRFRVHFGSPVRDSSADRVVEARSVGQPTSADDGMNLCQRSPNSKGERGRGK